MKKESGRQKAKADTRIRLLKAAKSEFIRRGLLGVSTVDVAKKAGVAHGTVFFHFQDRDSLLQEVMDGLLLPLTDELHRLLPKADGLAGMLDAYLDFLEREEPLYQAIARELPLYPPAMRRIVLGREAAVRHYFLRALEREMAAGRWRPVDPSAALGFLFGTIQYYLSLADAFGTGGKVIRAKRREIRETFLRLLANDERTSNG